MSYEKKVVIKCDRIACDNRFKYHGEDVLQAEMSAIRAGWAEDDGQHDCPTHAEGS